MAKLTKAQTKAHQQALDLIHSDKALTLDERIFCFENWNEAASNNVTRSGAFFSPFGMAADVGLHYWGGSLIDLCAGVGVLTFGMLLRGGTEGNSLSGWGKATPRAVCVELNSDYVEIGKRLVPEAEWVCADVLEWETTERFTQVVSNPPFTTVKTKPTGKYKGNRFEYRVMEKGMGLADSGVFIVPPSLAPFEYSGKPYYKERTTKDTERFERETGLKLSMNFGIDTSVYEWKNTKVLTEVVIIEDDK